MRDFDQAIKSAPIRGRKRDPWGLRVILGLSMLLVVLLAVKVFAHTVEEVRAMPRHLEGVE